MDNIQFNWDLLDQSKQETVNTATIESFDNIDIDELVSSQYKKSNIEIQANKFNIKINSKSTVKVISDLDYNLDLNKKASSHYCTVLSESDVDLIDPSVEPISSNNLVTPFPQHDLDVSIVLDETYQKGVELLRPPVLTIHHPMSMKKQLKQHKVPTAEWDNYLYITSRLLTHISSDDWDMYHPLSSEELNNTIGETKYGHIIKNLLKWDIIEVQKNVNGEDYFSVTGGQCKRYRLMSGHRKSKWVQRTITRKKIINQINRLRTTLIDNIPSRPLAVNIVKAYTKLVIPTVEQIEKRSLLEMDKGTTCKGKTLRSYKKDGRKVRDRYTYVEDHIDLFRAHTENGFMIPSTSQTSGGREANTISLMPSWIRNFIYELSGLTEFDFTSMHPVMLFNQYSYSEYCVDDNEVVKFDDLMTEYKCDMHQMIADLSGGEMTRDSVKEGHLSFFNKRVDSMKKMDIWATYEREFPTILNAIVNDKIAHKTHKITSRKCFTWETKIMEQVIAEYEGDCQYVYDALASDDYKLKEIMNSVALKQGYKHLEVK